MICADTDVPDVSVFDSHKHYAYSGPGSYDLYDGHGSTYPVEDLDDYFDFCKLVGQSIARTGIPFFEDWGEKRMDACFRPYLIPDRSNSIRLSKTALPHLDQEPIMTWMVLDLDLPDHRAWTDEDRETFDELNLIEPIRRSAYYMTEHGARILWPLREPVEASRWKAYASRFFDYLISQGVEDYFEIGDCIDDCTLDWYHSYRLPRVLRGVDFPEKETRTVKPEREHWYPVTPLDRLWEPPEQVDLADVDVDGDDSADNFHNVESSISDSVNRDLPESKTDDLDELVDEIEVDWTQNHDLALTIRALKRIDPDCGYKQWIDVLFCLHGTFGRDRAYRIWDAWSSLGDKYAHAGNQKDMERAYRELEDQGKTVASLFHHLDQKLGKEWRFISDDRNDLEELLATDWDLLDAPAKTKTINQARIALSAINPESFKQVMEIGRSVKADFDDHGFELWWDWASGHFDDFSDRYGAYLWIDELDLSEGDYTIGTLFHYVKGELGKDWKKQMTLNAISQNLSPKMRGIF